MESVLYRSNAMLVEQLVSNTGKLCIVHAPAGFGKTMLLNQARQKLQQRGAVVVDVLETQRGEVPPPWLLLDEPAAAVFDIDMVRTALDGAALSNTGVILATRHMDRLPIARLRAEGRTVRFGPHQLAISHRNAASALGMALDKKRAEWLGGLVAGWAVAISFLVDQARYPNARFDEDGDFLATSGLSDYIDQELLGDLPPDWVVALRFASIFSTCDGSMLDSIRPDNDFGRHLAPLRKHLPGLIDDHEGQTRLNPLLRLHLTRQFEQLPRLVRADALEQASRTCVCIGRTAEGANLAMRVGDDSAIVSFVRQSRGLRLWVTAGFDVIRKIVSQASVRAMEEEPRLKLLQCAVHMKSGEIGEGERLFDEALPLLSGDDEALGDANVVRTALLIYGCRDVTDDDIARFRQYVARNSDDPLWKTLILSTQCLLSIQRGDLDDAAGLIAEAVKHGRAAGAGYGLLFLDIHAANVALARGDLQRARMVLGQVRKAWRQKFSNDVGIQTIIDVLTASLEFETGRLSSARLHIRRSTHHMPHVEAWLDIYAATYEPMARLLVVDIGLPATVANLRAHRDVLIASGLPRVARMVKALEICLMGEAALRDKTSADQAAISVPEELSPLPSWHERELLGMAEAYAHLCQERPELAVEALHALLAFAAPRGLCRSSLRAKLLLVAALDQLGDDKGAEMMFDEALLVGANTGMIRVFAEVGGNAVGRRVVARLATVQEGSATDPKRLKLLRTLARWEDVSSPVSNARFTSREMDVLAALEQGGIDKLIGRRLGITEHAVRYHLKNIYRKLDVHDRASALSKAKDLGTLE